MRKILLFISLLFFFSLNSCKDKAKESDVNPPESSSSVLTGFNIYKIRDSQSPIGVYLANTDAKESVYASGPKNSSGELQGIESIQILNEKGKVAFNATIGEDGFVQEVNTIFEQGSSKLKLTNYNLISKTVQGEIVASNGNILMPKKSLPLNDETIEFLKLVEGLQNARTHNDQCNYTAMAAAYAGFILCLTTFTYIQLEVCTAAVLGGLGTVIQCHIAFQELKIVICREYLRYYKELVEECQKNDQPVPPLPIPDLMCTINAIKNATSFGGAMEDILDCNIPDNPEEDPADSWGDPHLITFDGLKYDFQAWGEFTAVRSTTDNFEVQVRYSGTKGGTISYNAGVAIQTGEDLISYTRDGLYINHLKQSIPVGNVTLKGGASISNLSSNLGVGIKVVTKWGDVIMLHGFRPRVFLSKTRKGKVEGLFGNYDGIPTNDLMLKDNKIIDIADLQVDLFSLRLPFEKIYPALPSSWRITQEKSLFHYNSGETTATYTELEYPNEPTVISAETYAAARKSCMDKGVTKEPFLSACTFDVSVSGDLKWIDESLFAQNNSTRGKYVQLEVYNDFSYHKNLRVTISKNQGVMDDSCLVDYVNGKVYPMKDGAKYANSIDGIFLTYCSIGLYTPQTILTCDFSCGTPRTLNAISNPKWPVYRKGAIEFLGFAKDDDPTKGYLLGADKFDEINSSAAIMANHNLRDGNLVVDNLSSSTTIVASNSLCVPEILTGKTLRRFITQDGKRGMLRINKWGEKNGRYFVEFDVKIQK